MRTATERDRESGVTTVRLAGELTLAAAALVHDAIGKAAAECPAAVLVDLQALERIDPALLSIFATASRLAQGRWGVLVLLYGASTEIRRELGVFRSFVSVHSDRWQAVTAVRHFVPQWRWQRLMPVPASAAVARGLLGEACLWWNLRHVREDARLIVSELATNAILHARTDFDVTASHTGRYLRIAVQDGSPVMPRAVDRPPNGRRLAGEPGWGLRLVAGASTHWGTVAVADGKIVWAVIGTLA